MAELFASPAADFDHPLEMLDGCHERIRRQCTLIGRIAGHVESRGVDDEARKAAASVLLYFDTAGRHHHRDEEDDLFPELRRQAGAAECGTVETLIAELLAEHRKLDALWAAMRAPLFAISEGRDAPIGQEAAKEFTAAYESHIAREEAQLLPLAAKILDRDSLDHLGASMARRRGVHRPGI